VACFRRVSGVSMGCCVIVEHAHVAARDESMAPARILHVLSGRCEQNARGSRGSRGFCSTESACALCKPLLRSDLHIVERKGSHTFGAKPRNSARLRAREMLHVMRVARLTASRLACILVFARRLVAQGCGMLEAGGRGEHGVFPRKRLALEMSKIRAAAAGARLRATPNANAHLSG
jgi:hypothetical protein